MSKGAQVVVTILAVLLALFLAPAIGTVWGLWVVGTWLLRRGGEGAPSAGKAVGAACVALVSVAFGAAVYPSVFAQRDPVSASSVAVVASPTPSPTPSPFVPPTVPDVVGSAPYAATGVLKDAGLRSTTQDAAPLDRDMYIQKNWTVVATEPPAGTPVAPGSEVTVLVLKNEEAAWFAAHPTMPRLPKGKPTDTLTERGGILAGMGELVLVRYDRKATPKDASEANDEYSIDGWEPAEETKARAGLKQAYEYSSLVVGSVPPAGQDLRVGRMIVVTVREKPRTETRYGDEGGRLPTVPRDGDGDDDVNVPGWLCPTRFC